MPRITVDMTIENIAKSISHLSSEECEKLLLLLSPEEKELKKRKDEILSGKVATISHSEIFDD